ncbi:hypothetical protein Sjap_001975 [Stephania japonica]|uniref:Uncharacterized protein n=1 Tax=Stephania japonica TaxID=461633 RepID=A0AAP0PTR6_9MAGN
MADDRSEREMVAVDLTQHTIVEVVLPRHLRLIDLLLLLFDLLSFDCSATACPSCKRTTVGSSGDPLSDEEDDAVDVDVCSTAAPAAGVRRMEDEEDDGGWRMKKMMQRMCAGLQLEVNRSRKKMMAMADSADGGRRMCSGWMKKMMADSRGVAECGSS